MNAKQLWRLGLLLGAALVVPACGGDGGGGTIFVGIGGGGISLSPGGTLDDGTSPWVEPTNGSPNRTFVSRGGNGTSEQGGNGGALSIANRAGSNLRVLRTGSVVTTFELPENKLSLGTNVRNIKTDTTLGVGTGLVPGIGSILGDDNLNPATGLRVHKGATLTLEPNWDADNADADNDAATGTLEHVFIGFNQGILIEGTVRTGFREGSSIDRSSLHLFADGGVIVSRDGKVDTSGVTSAPGTDGGDAGWVILEAYGSVITQGSMDQRGGDGDAGGNGADCNLWSIFWGIFNTGPIVTSGGRGNLSTGGNAGRIYIAPSYAGGSFTGGGAFNRADLTLRGGDGMTGGGMGGYLWMTNPSLSITDGPVVSEGDVDCSGGDALLSGNGGSVNPEGIQFWAPGGDARITGILRAKGGDGSGSGDGGNGGQIRATAGTGGGASQQVVGGGLYLAVSILASGGHGVRGGNGGNINLSSDAFFQATPVVQPGTHPTWIVGVTSVDLTGGNGSITAGNGGATNIRSLVVTDQGGTPWIGSILNEASVTSHGGDGFGVAGGNGGGANIVTDASFGQSTSGDRSRSFVNSGAFDIRGGSGTGGGNGGTFTLADRFHVENTGAIQTNGGSGTTSQGGTAGNIIISSDGITINDADLTANAGSATASNGRNGPTVRVEGRTASHAGNVSARGGDSVGVAGGNGGTITINSWDGIVLSVVSGTLGVQQGTSVTPGSVVGTVLIDGISIPLTDGSVTY